MADITTLLSKFLTNLWAGNITSPVTSSAIRTSTTAADTLKIQAYDTDGAAYTDLLTATAGTDRHPGGPGDVSGFDRRTVCRHGDIGSPLSASPWRLEDERMAITSIVGGAGNSTLSNAAGAATTASDNVAAGVTVARGCVHGLQQRVAWDRVPFSCPTLRPWQRGDWHAAGLQFITHAGERDQHVCGRGVDAGDHAGSSTGSGNVAIRLQRGPI